MMVALRPYLLLLTFTCILNITQTYSNDERKTYIVYMGSLPRDLEANSLPSLHISMAQRVLGSDFAPDAVSHSYHKSFNGFVVKLTEAEAARMRGLDCVISVFESRKHPVATTKSWDFIGFPQDVERQKEGHGFNESDIVVAVIDTGIWSEHETFNINDTNYPRSKEMEKWDTELCKNFKCNNKIIGAKSIKGGEADPPSVCPEDTMGHGTHVASIIAGREIKGANGTMVNLTEPDVNRRTVRGGVPWARIAVYKVCWPGTNGIDCADEDILAAFDEAIKDGVHIISVSLGQSSIDIDCSKEYFNNSFAIGAFHAMEKRIMTSLAADNHGPDPYSMTTYAPWLLSVAASTIGRNFSTTVTVQTKDMHKKEFKGVSLNTFPSDDDFEKPFLKPKACPPQPKETGDILLCDENLQPPNVGTAHKSGIVLESDKPLDFARIYAVPATVLGQDDYTEILQYEDDLAIINTSVVEDRPLEDADPPISIVSISSRGPNPMTPNILKPDIAAPGVHILAAWPPTPISGVRGDKRDPNLFKYNVQSGTSMACPHATAAAAYVKSFHPDWSPAALKSALMTTATEMKPNLSDGAEFAYGAGQINPRRAINPGLVYDAGVANYVNFLCAEGYDKEKIQQLMKKKEEVKCDGNKKGRVEDLNLPSFALSVDCNIKENEEDCPVDGSFERHLTNVEPENSNYKYNLSDTLKKSLQIKVEPECLSFEKKGDVKKFTLNIKGNLIEKDKASASSLWREKVSGSLTWYQVESCGQDPKILDGGYKVRSPIVVYNRNGSPERKCKTASNPIVREFGYQEGNVDATPLVT